MAVASNYLTTALLDNLFQGTAFTFPTSLYIALATTTPTGSTTGSTLAEPGGGAYARVAVNPSTANWATASGSPEGTSNSSTITFAQATANWGTVTAIAVCDAATGGNLLVWAVLGTGVAVNSGDTATISAGTLAFTLA